MLETSSLLCAGMVTLVFGIILILILLAVVSIGVVMLYGLIKPLFETEGGIPNLHYKESALAKFVLKRCPRLTEAFVPTFWARNPHAQTFIGALLPKETMSVDREFLQMKDKGIVAIDWCRCKEHKKLRKTSPILILIPGFCGDAYSVNSIIKEAGKRGYRCVVFNRRGHGDCPLTTPKLQSFGDPFDFRQVVKYIKGRFPVARLSGVSYSAGCGLLMSYLGEYGSSAYLSASVCISPAYDQQELYRQGIREPYNGLILYGLKRIISRHTPLAKLIDLEAACRAHSLEELEHLVYCKLNGQDNLETYWDKNNPIRDVDDISIPLLCINSRDDPISGPEHIPLDLFEVSPNFLLAMTQNGGHCGFLEGPSADCWADKVAVDFIVSVLDFIKNGEKDE